MTHPKPGEPGFQPTCPVDAREVDGDYVAWTRPWDGTVDRDATYFVREADGMIVGHRTGPSTVDDAEGRAANRRANASLFRHARPGL